MINSPLIVLHTFNSHLLMIFSVDETFLSRWENSFNSFEEPSFSVEILPL